MTMRERAVGDPSFNRFLQEERLMGSRCRDCNARFVPPRPICPACFRSNVEWEEREGEGRLAAFTVIAVAPPSMIARGYDRKNPYVSGVVELDRGGRVVARIVGVDATRPESIRVGMRMRVRFLHLEEPPAQETCLAFEPVEAGHAGKREGAEDALTKDVLAGRSVLLVDDEPDVLDSLEALLDMCRIARAGDFETAKTLLENDSFDIAVLDIMGVDGYRLLDIALRQDTLPVMLTAHALSVEDTIRSFEKGAASYLPKDQMADIATYLNDILEAKEKGKGFWWRWLTRMEEYYERKFGPEWKAKDKDFWRKLTYYT